MVLLPLHLPSCELVEIRRAYEPRRPPNSKLPIDSRPDSAARRSAFGLSLLASGVLLLGSPARGAEVLSGSARTVDGDTIVVRRADSCSRTATQASMLMSGCADAGRVSQSNRAGQFMWHCTAACLLQKTELSAVQAGSSFLA